ncbi:hypothetical protein [uncultured Jatrophihabitans sp.]|uniref:hypothetical protein n=1 Tax=uncultured Jatrophihabitans sp. TaxID=1610747 RepID=UPI0035CC76BC
MSSRRGVLLHGEWWDVSTVDEDTRREMRRSIEALEEIDVVRSSSTGADVHDANALIVLIVLDDFQSLTHYRSQPAYRAMAEYISPLGLYPDKMMQFNIEMPADAPAVAPHPTLLMHGCQVDAAKVGDDVRAELITLMMQLGRGDEVRTATAGHDLVATDAISQVVFLDSGEQLKQHVAKPAQSELDALVAREHLPRTQFSLELPRAPW